MITTYCKIAAGERFTPHDRDEAWVKTVNGLATKESTGFTTSFDGLQKCVMIEKSKADTFARHLKDMFREGNLIIRKE